MRGALALLVLTLAACGGGATAPTTSGGTASTTTTAPDPAAERRAGLERETVLLEELATRTCACADLACLETVDQELAAYLRVGTMNDVMTDEESWLPDLDARGKTAVVSMLTCMRTMQFTPPSLNVIALRMMQGFRDAGCACLDEPCLGLVLGKMTGAMAQFGAIPLGEIETEFGAVRLELQHCGEAVVAPLVVQATLELKAIRKAACGCADAACAVAVSAELEAYMARYASVRASAASAEEVGEVAGDVVACLEAALRE